MVAWSVVIAARRHGRLAIKRANCVAVSCLCLSKISQALAEHCQIGRDDVTKEREMR